MKIYGFVVDNETRCVHYHGEKDVVAVKFKCCNRYYPCYRCHEETADHEIIRWSEEEFDTKAVLCGSCKTELPIYEYMNTVCCPSCGHPFNKGCRPHYPLYFQTRER